MAKVTKQEKEEFKYKRFKQSFHEFNIVPDNAAETHIICDKLRKAVRIKCYCGGVVGVVLGLLTLIFIIGFMLLPLGIGCFIQGKKEVRLINKFEERYIREHFPESQKETVAA